MKKRFFKFIAKAMLVTLTYQLVFPACAYALTSGPSQPEVESFEPVGTTEMVDMLSGDFNYNIPLMDVEGYPINIFYHSGVGIEQEASWVGLGWNINPGEINRSVRGLPDDFNGEIIEKFTKLKEERDVRVGVGANIAAEAFGFDLSKMGIDISLGAGFYVAHNNYRGLSAGVSQSIGIKVGMVSTGITMGVGSQSGADVDLNVSASISQTYASANNSETSYGVSAGVGTGFNSRSGLKDISLSITPTQSYKYLKTKKNSDGTFTTKAHTANGGNDGGLNASIPVGLQNYVPVITNPMVQDAYGFQLKAGPEVYGGIVTLYLDVMLSNIKMENNGSRDGYGYLYSENAKKESIMDFSRDKDGAYNETMNNLPLSTNTYDIYSVNGQGTGGMFRPFRNDIGTIHDPYVDPGNESDNFRALVEVGATSLFEAGGDLTTVRTRNECGPWGRIAYGGDKPGTLYEKVFYKHGGDLSYNQQQETPQLFNLSTQYVAPDLNSLISHGFANIGSLPAEHNGTKIFWNNSVIDRSSRTTHIGYQTSEQIDKIPELPQSKKIVSYEPGSANHFYDPKVKEYNRSYKSKATLSGANHNAEPHHISVFTQTQADGRRYVYGIPAMNNATREVSFAVDESKANLANGYVGYTPGTDDGPGNEKGRDKYYSSTGTPAYAHSYLLTNVLSNDYVDILGDGVSDDDLGSFTKINYTLSDSDYRWRTPYHNDSAQFNPGFRSDSKDGKGNYLVGSRQQWYVRSVETKNYIAEFYTSKRKDAKGIQAAVLQSDSKIKTNKLNLKSAKSDTSYSYQLDSIRLYNKHDRYINKDNAVPVKTVVLQYDYSLCKNTPNSTASTKGKLTLKKIFIKYGNSQKNLLSPYTFEYNTSNPDYNFSAKDRWGNYKLALPGSRNNEFPYTAQPNNSTEAIDLNDQLSAWNLNDIKLPSGGKIHIDYESDDYAFVQDKRAMQMLKIAGVGSSKEFAPKNFLYTGQDNINDYVYFKRRKTKERAGVSMKDNYLENQEVIYYSFNLDINGKGSYENIKGYAKFDEVGICTGNDDYGYVRLLRDEAGNAKFHPATVYGINTARYYIPHIFYDGYEESSDLKKVAKGLFASGKEMFGTIIMRNPFKRWVGEKRGRIFNIDQSFIRLHAPDLAKKGGGIRVRQLTLSDNWSALSGNESATYGKKYDYTTSIGNYGVVSSGVAVYEPMIGNDENPFRKPVFYAMDKGRLLPAVNFFQEEPFGESFFPSPGVGYSSVKVTSIHQEEGRSAQSMDEHLFYTAKDFPVKIDYTQIGGDKNSSQRKLFKYTKKAEVLQGYSLIFNDMHGKPKAVNNYTIHQDGSSVTMKKITGVAYKYFTDANEKNLDNKVTALVRNRGTTDGYEIRQVTLGQDIDVSIDSRHRKTQTTTTQTNLNLNVFLIGIFPIFPFTVFHTEKEKNLEFGSLVTTKIVQQYGILKSIEQFDHDAITKTENLVFDAETGGVLLSKTNNQYNDNIYTRKDPAYLAYKGMGPAYTNMDYEETATLVVDNARNGFLQTSHMERFGPGDEILVDISERLGMRLVTSYLKIWILNETGGRVCRKDTAISNVAFWKASDSLCNCSEGYYFEAISGSVSVSIYKSATPSVLFASGTLSSSAVMPAPACTESTKFLGFNLPPGNYNYTLSGSGIYNTTGYSSPKSGTFTVPSTNGISIGLQNCRQDYNGPQLYTYWTTTACTSPFTPCIRTGITDSTGPCSYAVAPRFKDEFDAADLTKNISKWPTTAKTFSNVPIKVLRSGRRNNLDKMVQQIVFADPANRTSYPTDTRGYFEKYDNVISAGANTFTDTAQNYAGFEDSVVIPYLKKYRKLNAFVLGLNGNYRPSASFTPITKRTYAKEHTRFNGTYTIDTPFWVYLAPKCPYKCASGQTIMSPNEFTQIPFWKRASTITRYDPNGNALEERDVLGNYSSAQYGYNRLLPVGVAANVQAQHFMFEGFEDYNMLLPQNTAELYKKRQLHSLLGWPFAEPVSSVTGAYPSEQSSGDPAVFTRSGQRFYLMQKAPSGLGMELSNDASHTGNFSLKFTSTKSIDFAIADNNPTAISPFTMDHAQNYLVNFWAKSTSGAAITAASFTASIAPSSTSGTVSVKSGNIDGWYLVQINLDLKLITSVLPLTATIDFPADIYVDDLRFIPSQSNMKSFVYDPITFKLMAQLDENHFATFFEYDQEGLLIRTKKETSRGIMTISESRRSNAK
ncbi:MAG: hypothetical protein WC716_15870 [Chitinophagaceae bacterium]|jgi:hypothetical protein